MIVDFYDDYGALVGLEKIASEYDFERPKDLPKEAFAYPELRKFPLHTKEDAVMSALYIAKQADELPDYVEENALKALDVYGARDDFEKLVKISKKLSTEERKQLPDSVFGIPELRKYPMPDAEHVRKAITFFSKAPSKYKPQLARKIMQKAKEFGVQVNSDEVLRYAGAVKPDLKKAANMITKFRKYVIQDETLKQKYEKVAEILNKYAEEDITYEEVEGVIEAVKKLDKIAYEITGKKFSTNAEELILSKTAEEKVLEVKLVSESVPVDRITAIDDDTLKALIGFVPTKSDPQLVKDEIESLPQPEKEILEKYFKELDGK